MNTGRTILFSNSYIQHTTNGCKQKIVDDWIRRVNKVYLICLVEFAAARMSGLLSNQHRIRRSALASCGVGMHRAFSYNDVAETFESSFSYKKKFSSSFLLLLQRIVRYWEQNKYENCNSMQTKK
jgi:hypothetical protein